MTIMVAIIQALGTIVITLTLIVYFRQLNVMRDQLPVMRDQLAEMRNASRAQNLLSLVQFLQAPDVRAARKMVRVELPKVPFEQWDKERDWSFASTVCSSYDVAGIVLREGLVTTHPIVENWGSSIRDCYHTCEPFIKEMRRTSGENYWDDFEWLCDEAKRYAPKEA